MSTRRVHARWKENKEDGKTRRIKSFFLEIQCKKELDVEMQSLPLSLAICNVRHSVNASHTSAILHFFHSSLSLSYTSSPADIPLTDFSHRRKYVHKMHFHNYFFMSSLRYRRWKIWLLSETQTHNIISSHFSCFLHFSLIFMHIRQSLYLYTIKRCFNYFNSAQKWAGKI